ncbi:MAG: hypothetical protein M1834_002395 [Cirrosporium novae-zelandiae]|nr:MAG: hypothetical protein M1834_002395 [Cirrosporium novae-zelandiae]
MPDLKDSVETSQVISWIKIDYDASLSWKHTEEDWVDIDEADYKAWDYKDDGVEILRQRDALIQKSQPPNKRTFKSDKARTGNTLDHKALEYPGSGGIWVKIHKTTHRRDLKDTNTPVQDKKTTIPTQTNL